MRTIFFPHKRDPGHQIPDEEVQENIYPHSHEMNITEGGEFLDDAIRLEDEPPRGAEPKENE